MKIRKRNLFVVLIPLIIILFVFNGYELEIRAASPVVINYSYTITDQTFQGPQNIENNYHVAPGSEVTINVSLTNESSSDLSCHYGSNLESLNIHDSISFSFTCTPGDGFKTAGVHGSPTPNADFHFTVHWDAPSGGSGSSTSEAKNENVEPHTHRYFWEDTVAATENTDGEIVYKCECGDVLYRVPTSAYYVFNKNTMDKIKRAKQGETIKIETSKWISFHKMVMQALAERPDVSLEVSFLDGEYKGNRVSFTIPAGTDTASLMDDNGYSGFIYLSNKLGSAN